MLLKDAPKLPAWASWQVAAELVDGEPVVRARNGRLCVDVWADDAYPALLAEYRARYAQGHGDFMRTEKQGGGMQPEWAACLADLYEEPTTAYWLETAHQSAKMDVQRVAGFHVELHFRHRDPATKEQFSQAASAAAWGGEEARPVTRAAGRYRLNPEDPTSKVLLGTEAREHYKRLRGFVVA